MAIKPKASATVEEAAVFIQHLLDKHSLALTAKVANTDPRHCWHQSKQGTVVCSGTLLGQVVSLQLYLDTDGVLVMDTAGLYEITLSELILDARRDGSFDLIYDDELTFTSDLPKLVKQQTQTFATRTTLDMARVSTALDVWQRINAFTQELLDVVSQFEPVELD